MGLLTLTITIRPTPTTAKTPTMMPTHIPSLDFATAVSEALSFSSGDTSKLTPFRPPASLGAGVDVEEEEELEVEDTLDEGVDELLELLELLVDDDDELLDAGVELQCSCVTVVAIPVVNVWFFCF